MSGTDIAKVGVQMLRTVAVAPSLRRQGTEVARSIIPTLLVEQATYVSVSLSPTQRPQAQSMVLPSAVTLTPPRVLEASFRPGRCWAGALTSCSSVSRPSQLHALAMSLVQTGLSKQLAGVNDRVFSQLLSKRQELTAWQIYELFAIAGSLLRHSPQHYAKVCIAWLHSQAPAHSLNL